MTETLAIIPARGGSKGVPGKNVRLLGGQPLIVHSRLAELSCESTRTAASTDPEEEFFSRAGNRSRHRSASLPQALTTPMPKPSGARDVMSSVSWAASSSRQNWTTPSFGPGAPVFRCAGQTSWNAMRPPRRTRGE